MLKRTRATIAFEIRARLFDIVGMQSLVQERERRLLEDHMGFRGQLESHRQFQIQFLKSRGLKSSHDCLEIGCGPLTAGLPVIGFLDPGRYVGVDVRPEVLNLSWIQVGKAGLSSRNPRLVCSTTFGNDELGDQRFDYVLTFSVLYHLSDDLLKAWFDAVARRLKPDGQAFANINTEQSDSTWLQFPFLHRSFDTYKALAAASGLATEQVGQQNDFGLDSPYADGRQPLLRFTRE